MNPCKEKHEEGASEWHSDGRLCQEWLENLERGKFDPRLCRIISSLIIWDGIMHFNHVDRGQLVRLEVSLSQTLPKRTWFRSLEAVLGPFKGKFMRDIEQFATDREQRRI